MKNTTEFDVDRWTVTIAVDDYDLFYWSVYDMMSLKTYTQQEHGEASGYVFEAEAALEAITFVLDEFC